MNNANRKNPHAVIVGGGFAGLNAAKVLGREASIDTTIIDRHNYHLFQPLLYQVATAGLSPADIAVPIRSVLAAYPRVEVLLGNVNGVDLGNRTVSLDGSKLLYDYLILACGAKHSYFGHSEWEDNAPGLKTLEQATEIRRRILLAFELAEKESELSRKSECLSFIVVGGGPTGVELSGAICEIGRFTLERDFRHIDPKCTRVILIEAGERILPSFSEKLSGKARLALERLGVQVLTSTRVTEVRANGVFLGSDFLPAATVIWAAGVQPSSLGKCLGVPLDHAGRVIVEKDLSIKGHPEVFVVGDQAHFFLGGGRTLPGLAAVAMQQGRAAAENIVRCVRGESRKDFIYQDKGQMATIGRKAAVIQAMGLELNGTIAWLAWLFIHIYYLVGFKNRFLVFFQWAWSYFTFRRGARLIMDKEWRSESRGENRAVDLKSA